MFYAKILRVVQIFGQNLKKINNFFNFNYKLVIHFIQLQNIIPKAIFDWCNV